MTVTVYAKIRADGKIFLTGTDFPVDAFQNYHLPHSSSASEHLKYNSYSLVTDRLPAHVQCHKCQSHTAHSQPQTNVRLTLSALVNDFIENISIMYQKSRMPDCSHPNLAKRQYISRQTHHGIIKQTNVMLFIPSLPDPICIKSNFKHPHIIDTYLG